MSDYNFAVTNLILVSKWDQAGWNGIVFGFESSGEAPPFMGILFSNVAAGQAIFDDWIHRFGATDEFDEIRIAIIEGDIPSKNIGYSVTIGSDVEGITQRAKKDNQNFDPKFIGTITRCHRMNPAPNSPHLPGFKNAYNKLGEYLLLPVFGSTSQPKPEWDLAIRKRKILFRDVSDVSIKDIDSVIFQ